MAELAKEIARPAALRKRLKIYRVVEGDLERFNVKDEVLSEEHTFEPWQFFVLEALFGCETFDQLSSVFQDRFGSPLSERDLDDLFALVEKKKWFSFAGLDHPVVVASRKRTQGIAVAADGAATKSGAKPSAPAEGELPPGVNDALGLDSTKKKHIWKLFDPRLLLKLSLPVLRPLRHVMYVLPLLVLLGIGVLVNYADLLKADFEVRRRDVPLITHLLISMLTDNLLATWAMALVAYQYRATVDAFGIVAHFWVLPRFIARIGHVKQLTRREVMWLHAAPMLTRLALFNIGILTWFAFRSTHHIPSSFGITLATASAFSLAITGNPLIKSNAYFLLSAFLNEPYLRGKSTRALLVKLTGKGYEKADANILAAYAMASAVFIVIAIVTALYLLENFLTFHLGGPGIAVLVAIAALIVWLLTAKLIRLNKVYKRTSQFEQWRERALPASAAKAEQKKQGSKAASYALRASLLLLLAVMFLPYSYEVGGPFVVLPAKTQNVTSALNGLVQEIHFDGGETLAAGTVIGRLSYAEDEVQVKTLDAKIAEQEAVIAELKSRPLAEEVRLAEENLKTAATRARLSKQKLDRMEGLYASTVAEVQLAQRKVDLAQRTLETAETRATFSKEQLLRTEDLYRRDAVSLEDLEEVRREHEIDAKRVEEERANIEVMKTDLKLKEDDSLDELEDVRREHELDLQQVEEARASLELIKVGAKPEQIQAAEEKLQGWKDERQYYVDRVEQSYYTMPFDGTLVATRLKEKIGSYVNKGEILAVAEQNAQVIMQVDIAEPDVGWVRAAAPVRCRLPAYFDEEFGGAVTQIDSTVTDAELDAVVRVTVLVENGEGRLKSGMTGYAKIASEELPVWKVLSLGVIRFFKVEVWSWLP